MEPAYHDRKCSLSKHSMAMYQKLMKVFGKMIIKCVHMTVGCYNLVAKLPKFAYVTVQGGGNY